MKIKTKALKYDLRKIDKKLGDNFWKPLNVAKINDWVLRAAAFKGEFHWHKHDDDEFFLIYKGEIVIDTENGSIKLSQGEGIVIPKGIQHRPRAVKRALVLRIEARKLDSSSDKKEVIIR